MKPGSCKISTITVNGPLFPGFANDDQLVIRDNCHLDVRMFVELTGEITNELLFRHG